MHAKEKTQRKTNISKQVLLNYMARKDVNSKRIIPDLLNMKYEYLFKTIGRHGKYSLGQKCLFLVLILFIPCLIANSFSETPLETLLVYFIDGWGHFVATAFIGVFAWFVIRFLKRINEQIEHVNEIISPSKPSQKSKKKTKNGTIGNAGRGRLKITRNGPTARNGHTADQRHVDGTILMPLQEQLAGLLSAYF